MVKTYSRKILFISIFVLAGFILGGFAVYFNLKNRNISAADAYPVREGGYNFINPLIACDISENKQYEDYLPLTSKYKNFIDRSISNNDATQISVYFRDLDAGHWSGVNENTFYSPASLLKVPIMIAYLKQVYTIPNILKKKIIYHRTADENALEYFKPEFSIKDGEIYTVDQLLHFMIQYSDNNAARLLQNNIDPKILTEVYSDLTIPISDADAEENISPKIYSFIFRVLYNATYLSKPMSQYALMLLTSADFPGGIKAGIPVDMSSAQKFGERTVINENTTGQVVSSFKELHDCGIVYYPHNPYFLCIMTKGDDFSKLKKILGDISDITYKEIDSGVLKE